MRGYRRSEGSLFEAALLLLALANLLGCAAWNEAFRDRVTDRKPTVQFGCAAFAPAAQSGGTAVAQGALILRGAPGPVPAIVGELYQWNDLERIPVSVAGRLPNAVLVADAGPSSSAWATR